MRTFHNNLASARRKSVHSRKSVHQAGGVPRTQITLPAPNSACCVPAEKVSFPKYRQPASCEEATTSPTGFPPLNASVLFFSRQQHPIKILALSNFGVCLLVTCFFRRCFTGRPLTLSRGPDRGFGKAGHPTPPTTQPGEKWLLRPTARWPLWPPCLRSRRLKLSSKLRHTPTVLATLRRS